MKFPFKFWISAAVVAGAVALALYARPRAYQTFVPEPMATNPAYPATHGEPRGRIAGRLVWRGELPKVPNVEGMMSKIGIGPVWTSIPNPAAPKISPQTRGIAETVVFLKEAPSTVKPWPYPPLTICVLEDRIALVQGNTQDSLGFTPVGSEVEIVSHFVDYQMLRARGAAFFTIPLPRPYQPQRRTFANSGHVALTSAVGQIAAEADLFVCEHPYFTKTDLGGHFELTGVPPGEYELVAWLKNWKIASRDHDPETGKILRLNYEAPLTVSGRVRVVEGRSANIELSLP